MEQGSTIPTDEAIRYAEEMQPQAGAELHSSGENSLATHLSNLNRTGIASGAVVLALVSVYALRDKLPWTAPVVAAAEPTTPPARVVSAVTPDGNSGILRGAAGCRDGKPLLSFEVSRPPQDDMEVERLDEEGERTMTHHPSEYPVALSVTTPSGEVVVVNFPRFRKGPQEMTQLEDVRGDETNRGKVRPLEPNTQYKARAQRAEVVEMDGGQTVFPSGEPLGESTITSKSC